MTLFYLNYEETSVSSATLFCHYIGSEYFSRTAPLWQNNIRCILTIYGEVPIKKYKDLVVLLFLTLLCSFQSFSPRYVLQNTPATQHILIINAYHKGYGWTDTQNTTIRNLLRQTDPNATIVFGGILDYTAKEIIGTSKNVTGVYEQMDPSGALSLIGK